MTKRTLDTMSDAIALSSPSGHMSARARKQALARLGQALFDGVDLHHLPPQPRPSERLRQQAQTLLDLAARGMKPKAYPREAARLLAQAAQLETQENRSEIT
jgi:hypothetical protein